MVAAVHNQIGVPLVLAGCFIVGMMVVPRKPPDREPETQQKRPGPLRHVPILLKTIALAATGKSALFGDDGQSAHIADDAA
jgi:hypothetical protein